jgi:hypothetical protein
VATARRAIEIATATGDRDLAREVEGRLAAYQQERVTPSR